MTVDRLLALSTDELDYLFSESETGPMPDGVMDGTAIVVPGTAITQAVSSLIHFWGWRGKIFNAQAGTLANEVSALGLRAIVADVYKGSSFFDRKECIILDYKHRSFVAQFLRDEIRMLEDGLYLGKAYGHSRALIHFALKKAA